MRKTLLTFAIIMITAMSLPAQEEVSEPFISVGPSLAIKMGINAVTPPIGRQNGLSFNSIPDFGVQAFINMGETNSLGMIFDIGYSTYSYKIKAYNYLVEGAASDVTYTHKFSYLTLSSSLFFKGFLFGFNVGFPMSGDFGATIEKDNIQTMAEFTTGGIFPLYADESGIFNLHIKASYMLTGVLNSFKDNDPLKNIVKVPPPDLLTNDANPRVASVSVGFSYLFNVY